jgi:hypothetical protein
MKCCGVSRRPTGERRRAELCGGRCLAVAYGDGFELDVSRLQELGAGEFEVSGGASSFYDALDLLVGGLVAAGGGSAGEVLDRLDDDDAADDGTPLAGIVSPGRRLLAMVLLSCGGPMDLVTGRFAGDFYLGGALDGWRTAGSCCWRVRRRRTRSWRWGCWNSGGARGTAVVRPVPGRRGGGRGGRRGR